MDELYYKIELFSDWHAGSGLASGADVDLLVKKDKNNFPFIPGKTLKGLLKDAAKDLEDVNVVSDKVITKIFGKEVVEKNKSIEGKAFFSNGELTQNLKEKSIDKTRLFYRKVSSTAIEENGLAKEHSLRRMEVTVPLVLFAKIENVSEKDCIDVLEKCMKMTKRLGSWRNRGLGRCELSIVSGGGR